MKYIEDIYNFDEYDDPIRYDQNYRDYQKDLPLLFKWASKTNGTIIDIACGTGRATIPLAKQGYKVIGVDVHKGMLEEAQKKSHTIPGNVEWVLQDCSNLSLSEKAGLIFTVGNSFQHFLTNEVQDDLLSSIREHLDHNGIFIFGTRFPNAYELLSEPVEELEGTYKDDDTGLDVDVFHLSKYDALEQVQHNSTIRRYKHSNGDVIHEERSNISLRFVFPKEMERLLSKHGLSIINVYRDWSENPITNDSQEMIYICQKE